MAEGLVKALYGDRVFVDSIGVRDGELDPMAVAVMAEIGVDISRHRPKRLDDLLDTSFDLIVTLSPEAHHQSLEKMRGEAVDVVFWPTYDPSGDPSGDDYNRETQLAAYRDVRDSLKVLIEDLFADQDE